MLGYRPCASLGSRSVLLNGRWKKVAEYSTLAKIIVHFPALVTIILFGTIMYFRAVCMPKFS